MQFFRFNRRAVCTLAIGLVGTYISSCALHTADSSVGVHAEGNVITGEYIVLLKPGQTMRALSTASASPSDRKPSAFVRAYERAKKDGSVLYEFQHAIQGFALRDSNPNALDAWKSHTEWVADVAPNISVFLEPEPKPMTAVSQNDAPWNLARIDQQDWDPYNQDTTYDHLTNGGEGVRAYVIDSGIYTAHQEFCANQISNDCVTRIDHAAGYSSVGDPLDYEDSLGHGTHVAGIIGGLTYGVAKAITLVPIRVFGPVTGEGSVASIIAGVDYVTGNAQGRPAVANMSLKVTPVHAILNLAVRNSIASGIVYAVSAGNDYGANACWQSPAAVPEALTVGATDQADRRADFSNGGPCVDIVAPGHAILSANDGQPYAFTMRSGTSMAAPHVAGIAALWLQTLHAMEQPASVSDVMSGVLCHSTPDKITDLDPLQPNLFAFTGPITAPDSGYHAPPVPAFQVTKDASTPAVVGRELSLSLLFEQLPCFVRHVAVYQNDALLTSQYFSTQRSVTVKPVSSGATLFRVVVSDGLDRQAEAELEVEVQPFSIRLPIIL